MLSVDLLKLLLVFDFDKTITTADTTDLIASSIISSFPDTAAHRNALWSDILTAYDNDYAALANVTNPLETSANTIDLPTLHAEYASYLATIRFVELASINRTSTSGVFANITSKMLTNMGAEALENGNVALRNKFVPFLNKMREWGIPAKILSVGWSASFIVGVLMAAGANMTNVEIVGNDITTEGVIAGGIYTATDKLREIRAMIHNKCSKDKYDDVVYFGDSETDLLALADVRGVVVGFANATSSLKAKIAKYENVSENEIVQIAKASNKQKIMELNDYADAITYFFGN